MSPMRKYKTVLRRERIVDPNCLKLTTRIRKIQALPGTRFVKAERGLDGKTWELSWGLWVEIEGDRIPEGGEAEAMRE